jgi:23S rRNA (guanosine2251-2'-O)-methyltransferase
VPETIYGVRPVTEALRGGRREVSEVLDSTGNSEVAQAAKAAGVPVKKVSRARVGELARGAVHQGVAARVGPYPYVDLEDLLAASDPLVVVLDGVTDPHNLGAVMRVAEGAGASGVVIPKDRAGRRHPEALGGGRPPRRPQGERGR